jgi:hypothetical protein|nr:MAG TPA: hypothetical protein [Caudoviricetes sp.]
MAKLSELQSKVTGSAINVDPLGKKRPTTQTVFNTLQQSVSQSAAPSPRISKTTAPSSLPESKGKKVTLPTVKQKTNPLTTPAKSGFFEGLSILPSSADELISPYAWGRAGTALLGAAEGVTDFIGSGFYKGVQGISSLGGLAPNPVSEWAGRNADAFLDNSITQDLEQKLAEKYNPSQGAQNVTGIGQTVVQMLPGIGASKVVSAAGKGLNAAQALSSGENVGRALFGIQAAGNAASQAKAEGADTGRALAFGAASGALETAIEGIAGGIPGLGGGKVGKIAEAVKASPLVSRALDIAGEGGEEALSTVLTPYLQRAIYDPDAPNATPEEIAQSAIMGAVAAGVLQGGLELPGAISNAASDIRTTRRAIGSNEDIAQRATANLQAGQNMARYSSGNPLAVTLPTVEESKSGLFLPGSPAYQQADNRMPGEQVIRAELPGAGQKNADVEPLVSIDNIRRYQSAIDGVFMGTLPTGADIVLGQTPSILAEYGAPALDLHMRQSVARKIAYPSGYMGGKHNLGLSALKNLPYQLADPIAIIENPQSNSRGLASKIVLTEWNDLDGKPVIIPIHLNAQGAIDVQNDVASAFGADYIQRIIGNNGENVLYTKNNEDIYQLLSKGRPVPQAMADDVLARNSIPPAGQDVNLQQGDRGETQDPPREGPGPAFETGPESSVGAARKGFDPWSEFQGTKSEFFPEGANVARPVDVPTTDPQGRPIRKTASTAMGAKAIPDEAVGDIQNMVLRGELSYDRVSDRTSIDRAVRTIEEKGYQRALEEFSTQVRKGLVSKDIATLGQQLLVNAANAGDGKATAELLSLYAQMETTAGQAVQAASILRKLAPSDQLYAAQHVVIELEKTIQKNYKDLEITIDPALIEEFNQQTDQTGRDAVLDKIKDNVAAQVPATWQDKWNAWRYMAMLFNPRTHIRNIVGNVGFQPLRWTKDRVAAAIEAGVSKASGGKLERTKSFAANPALYKAAWADWTNVQDVLSGNKYDDIRSDINSRRRIFKTLPLEAARKGNSAALEFEDAIFKRITYADALAGYLQSNGVTAEQMRNNTVDAQILSRARDYAGREALKATYQDRNMVSDKVVQIARDLGPAGEAVLPFKRTPANILVRGMEYSPAGLAKALTYDLIQVKRGRMTGAEAIDHIASGLTGSGLMALGAYLFAQGIVTSGGGDDEGQDAINDLTGVQNYALNLPGGGNVTLDWLAPEALPFFMGVELIDSMGQGGNTAEGISTALKSISDPMLELSMLQSLNDVIDSVSFSENKLGALVSSALVSYFTQPIPTFGGQIERSAEDVRMTTYTDKNLRLPTDIQYAIGRASARIPGWDYQQVPYIDAWGREEKSGTLPMRAMDNFLNPAYTSSMQVTDVDKEIQRLYNQTGDGGVVPDRPQKYITVDGERVDLTGEQYVEYATKRGQTQFKLLEELLDSSLYRSLGDEEKTQAVSSVYNYADMLGKAAVSDYQPEDWVAEAQNAKKEFGISTSEYLLLRGQYGGSLLSGKKVREAYQAGMPAQDYLHWAVQEKDTDGSGRTNQAETIAAIETSGLSQEEKDVLYAVEQVSDAGRRKWERARDWGLSVEDYQRYYAIYSGDGKKEEKLTALQRAGMTAAQANYFWSLMSKN